MNLNITRKDENVSADMRAITSDSIQSPLGVVQALRDGLEIIAISNSLFTYKAEKILAEMHQEKNKIL